MATFTVTEHDNVTNVVVFAGQATNVVDALAACVPHILRAYPSVFGTLSQALTFQGIGYYGDRIYLLTVSQP
jgi:hypothetical protein